MILLGRSNNRDQPAPGLSCYTLSSEGAAAH
jgi:hypothetical protein